jgi:hypothetical protein
MKNVEITQWGDWNKAFQMQVGAEKKTRKRAQNTGDNTPTVPGQSPDDTGTEGEVELEGEVEKGSSIAKGVLPFEKKSKIDKLVLWCDDHADSRTEGQFSMLALELPEGSIAKVLESCLQARDVRNRAGYALNALKSEAAELAA